MTGSAYKLLSEKLWRNYDPYYGLAYKTVKPDIHSGWGSQHRYLADAVVTRRPSIIVEIGVWKGASCMELARTVQRSGLDAVVVACDTWLGSSEHWNNDEWHGELGFQFGYPTMNRTFLANMILGGVKDVVLPLPLDSTNAAIVFQHFKIFPDLIHIDGAHDFESVLNDLNRWWNLLAPGGMIIMDDYSELPCDCPGVRRAVRKFFQTVKVNDFEAADGECRFVKPAAIPLIQVKTSVDLAAGAPDPFDEAPRSELDTIPNQPATIFLRLNESIFVPDCLRSIQNQDLDKSITHLYISCYKLSSPGRSTLGDFIASAKLEYRNVVIDEDPDDISREKSVAYAIDYDTNYISVDQTIILHPHALRRLMSLDLEVAAPMLNSGGAYSNFHAYVDGNGYYKDGENYWKILNRTSRGVFEVPVVNGCYVVRKDKVPLLQYSDRSRRVEYVILSAGLREALVRQYIDNTFDYGIILGYAGKPEAEIRRADLINNKSFYLKMNEKSKKAIVCDADWLANYLTNEAYYLVKLLSERYGYDIINSQRLDLFTRHGVDDLNGYDVLIVFYHSRVPLGLSNALKIYKMDDVENNPENTRIDTYNLQNSDIVISPYAYVLNDHYRHDDVVWVPYSSSIEDCEGHESISFNDSPKAKILVSGNMAKTYPFRRFVASLNIEETEVLPHPGYGGFDREKGAVGTRWFQKLNEYLCCFTDALVYRFILLKNFEIASVGSLLLTDKAIEKEMNELGFVDYKTCIFCDQESFLEKAAWIVDEKNRKQVDRIRKAGMKLVWERHLTSYRADQINSLVEERMKARATATAGREIRDASPVVSKLEASSKSRKAATQAEVLFPEVFVINLDERVDRWEAVQKTCRDSGLDPVRVSAERASPGWVGCGRSHLKAIRNAKEKGLPWVLILEDDALFDIEGITRFRALLPYLWNHRDKWERFSGGPLFPWNPELRIFDIHRQLVHIRGRACHFDLIQSAAYDRILAWDPAKERPIDMFYCDLADEGFRNICTYPHIATQVVSKSDVMGDGKVRDATQFFNYSICKLRECLDSAAPQAKGMLEINAVHPRWKGILCASEDGNFLWHKGTTSLGTYEFRDGCFIAHWYDSPEETFIDVSGTLTHTDLVRG